MNGELTVEEVISIATEHGLEKEVQRELDNGATPWQALREYDLLPGGCYE